MDMRIRKPGQVHVNNTLIRGIMDQAQSRRLGRSSLGSHAGSYSRSVPMEPERWALLAGNGGFRGKDGRSIPSSRERSQDRLE